MPIVVQLPCPVRCRQSKSGKKILSSELLWIFDQQHVQRGTACSVVEYVEQIIDCDVKNERQVLRTPRIWHPKNREFFFAWMWSNTADAIMFVIWCHTTQLEGVNFYYVKGQLTRRLEYDRNWLRMIDWKKMSKRRLEISSLLVILFITCCIGANVPSPGCKVKNSGKVLQCRGVGLNRIPETIPDGIVVVWVNIDFSPWCAFRYF